MASKDSTINNDKSSVKMGGFAYFLSFITVLILAGLTFRLVPKIIEKYATINSWFIFACGASLGFLIAKFLIRGKLSVLLHEVRHSVISNLVGNKWKQMAVQNSSGHFEYAYSKSTAHYNAFIALAPYWLPLMTIAAIGIAFAIAFKNALLARAILGLGWGADITLNLRDISPHQSDFSSIRGGFTLGVIYVTALNILITCLVVAWVSGGLDGLKMLANEIWLIGKKFVAA